MKTDSHNVGSRRIRLLRPLGKGGFGAVYLAEVHSDDGLVHRMAVKLLHEEFSADGEMGARARDEARLMSQLNHDNVVQIYGLTSVGERAAVLMEFVEGIDCNALIRHARGEGRGVPFRSAGRIIECAADALDQAFHAISPQTKKPLRVVHRDIKPGNLLVSTNGVVKVMDFGVARADFEREAETRSMMFGTQRYMAPERWLEGEAGHESDVYALGMTFWELVTGERFAQVPFAPRLFEARIDEVAKQFLAASRLEGRNAVVAESLLRGMLAYKVANRTSAKEVCEVLGELTETSSGPSLRRYARQWIPELMEIRSALLERDSELVELTGTLLTANSAGGQPVQKSGVPPEDRDPKHAPTYFEALELEPRPLMEKVAPASSQSGESQSEKASFHFSSPAVAISLALGVALVFAWTQREGSSPIDLPEQGVAVRSSGVEISPVRSETAQAEGGVEEFEEAEESALGSDTPLPRAEIVTPRTPPKTLVPVKILADPREGGLEWRGQQIAVSEILEIPEGSHDFSFEGEGWSARCRETIDSSVKKLKFSRSSGTCTVLR